MMYGLSGIGMFGGWLTMLVWIVILVAVIYLVIFLLDRITKKSDSSRLDAEQILRERYARGEIDTETFEEMKEHLKRQ
ncbi:SHOCT domain-containing protein [Alicyclobacillus acidiphilus]|uniref:SHOCT domain-containing protein n=1 Tax=Alicyclobacillus acidiphilus TaxID=182455 RepID=UPI0008309FA4|nr:SHOCT domain-containing protein [Alicyclobacillus acidiphilus]MCL6444456.1 SHOCT domain-containing protein [Alicyclobacillus sp.]